MKIKDSILNRRGNNGIFTYRYEFSLFFVPISLIISYNILCASNIMPFQQWNTSSYQVIKTFAKFLLIKQMSEIWPESNLNVRIILAIFLSYNQWLMSMMSKAVWGHIHTVGHYEIQKKSKGKFDRNISS